MDLGDPVLFPEKPVAGNQWPEPISSVGWGLAPGFWLLRFGFGGSTR